MARGRHRRRSGLLSRLRRRALPRRRSRFDALAAQTARLRRLTEVGAATATAALVRAVAAEDAAAAAEVRARQAERALVDVVTQMSALRTELAALREELVWAFAEERADIRAAASVIDLRARAVGAVDVV